MKQSRSDRAVQAPKTAHRAPGYRICWRFHRCRSVFQTASCPHGRGCSALIDKGGVAGPADLHLSQGLINISKLTTPLHMPTIRSPFFIGRANVRLMVPDDSSYSTSPIKKLPFRRYTPLPPHFVCLIEIARLSRRGDEAAVRVCNKYLSDIIVFLYDFRQFGAGRTAGILRIKGSPEGNRPTSRPSPP